MNTSPKIIGVLKLNTSFPRLPGDIGNPASFDYPVEYITVTNAIPGNITVASALPESLQLEFLDAAKSLINKNVSLISTTCGFLSTMQDRLAQLSNIPVICSALSLLPLLASIHGGTDRIGVLTFNPQTLNTSHMKGISPAAVEGLLPTDELRKVINDDLTDLNQKKALQNVVAACDRLKNNAPGTTAILLECTNLSPYKDVIRQHTRMAVYDIVDAIHWQLKSQYKSVV